MSESTAASNLGMNSISVHGNNGTDSSRNDSNNFNRNSNNAGLFLGSQSDSSGSGLHSSTGHIMTIDEGSAGGSSMRGRGRGRSRGGSNGSQHETMSSPIVDDASLNSYETPSGETASENSDQPKRPRRRKVEHACIYCRRSHMTCDEGRPCSRCIRRNIGHLCRDEPKKKNSATNKVKTDDNQQNSWGANTSTSPLEPTPTSAHQPTAMILTSQAPSGMYRPGSSLVFQELVDHSKVARGDEKQEPQHSMQPPQTTSNLMNKNIDENANGSLQVGMQRSPFNDWSSLGNQSILSQTSEFNHGLFFSEHANSEFASLGDFLTMIEDPNANPDLLLPPGPISGLSSAGPLSANESPGLSRKSSGTDLAKQNEMSGFDAQALDNGINGIQGRIEPVVSDSARDKFFLTAADPSVDVSPEERLKQVIRAKVEAGLLQPFNYARGYARLQKYMDNYMNESSKQRILKPLSIFRPAFRAIAQSLMDIDLVLVEEAFERMLLDYDRVFTSMAIPACLWRRTGEIYRGNKEFAGLVEVSVDNLRDGKLAIYELMSEESAVNYWEKYGNIAFDSGQKAVLTSCNLRTKDRRKRRACCFSFTIQRDRYNM